MLGGIYMEYEIVNLKQKTLVGLSARTSNDSLDMGNVIGGLWETFIQVEYMNKLKIALMNLKQDSTLLIQK